MAQNVFNKSIGISRTNGPALLMTKEDHALTRTFGWNDARAMKEDIGLNARKR